MLTCNIIHWSIIVIPILTFGSEIWCLSEHDYDSLISFQRLTGKQTLVRLKYCSIVKHVLLKRVQDFKNNRDACSKNKFASPTYEMLNAAIKLCVFNLIYDICINRIPLFSKRKWSWCIWAKTWQ